MGKRLKFFAEKFIFMKENNINFITFFNNQNTTFPLHLLIISAYKCILTKGLKRNEACASKSRDLEVHLGFYDSVIGAL